MSFRAFDSEVPNDLIAELITRHKTSEGELHLNINDSMAFPLYGLVNVLSMMWNGDAVAQWQQRMYMITGDSLELFRFGNKILKLFVLANVIYMVVGEFIFVVVYCFFRTLELVSIITSAKNSLQNRMSIVEKFESGLLVIKRTLRLKIRDFSVACADNISEDSLSLIGSFIV